MNNTTGLTKILNGINTTLNIANKAIPIYNQAKPIFKTVNKTYKTIKNNKNDLTNMIKLMKVKNQIKKDMNNNTNIQNTKLIKDNYSNLNNPTFFI